MVFKYSFEQAEPVVEDKTTSDEERVYSFETASADTTSPTAEPTATEFAPMPAEQGLGEYSEDPSLDRAMAKRAWQAKQTSESLEKGEIGLGSAALQTTGQTIGRVIDWAGEEVAETAKGLYSVAPDIVKQGVESFVETISDVAGTVRESGLYETEPMMVVGDVLGKAVDNVGDYWNSLDKNTRKNLESAGLIAAVTPVKRGADLIHKGTVTLKTNLRNQIVDKAFDQISPFTDKGRLIEIFKRKKLKGSKGVYEPTAYERAAAETVADLKGFKYGKGGDYNGLVIEQAKKDAVKNLDIKLKSTERPIAQNINQEISNGIQELKKKSPIFEAANTKPLQDRIATAQRILKRNEPAKGGHTTYSLNKARRKFDELMEAENKAADWSQGRGTPLHQLTKNLRDTMNRLVDENIPPTLKGEREKVGHLIYASSNMAEKYSRNTQSVIDHAVHILSKIARISWATKMLGGVGVASAVTAAMATPATAAVAAAIGGITFVGGKAVMSRPVRKSLLSLMTELDKAGKAAKTVAEKTNIKKTRTALAALVANATIEQSQEEQE